MSRYPRIPVPQDLTGAFDQIVEAHQSIVAKRQEIKDLEAKRHFLASVIESEIGRSLSMERDGHRVTLGTKTRLRLVEGKKLREDYPYEEHPYLYNSPSPSYTKVRDELPQSEADKYLERTLSVTVSQPADPLA